MYLRAASLRQRATSAAAAAAIRAPSRYATPRYATPRYATQVPRRDGRDEPTRDRPFTAATGNWTMYYTTILRYRLITVRDSTALKGDPTVNVGTRRIGESMLTPENTLTVKRYEKRLTGPPVNGELVNSFYLLLQRLSSTRGERTPGRPQCQQRQQLQPERGCFGGRPSRTCKSTYQRQQRGPEQGRFGGRPYFFSAQQHVLSVSGCVGACESA